MTTTVRRGTSHPSLWARTPARADDWFDADQLADLRAYARPLRRLRTGFRAVTLLVDAWLIFGLDLGPHIQDALDGWPWPLQLGAVLVAFLAIDTVLSLPVDYWATMVHDRRHGLSNQSVGLWLADQVKELVLTVVLLTLLLVPVFAAVRSFDSWWLVGGLAFLAVQVVIAFVYPVLVMPRFNRFTPMEDGVLRRRIEEIAGLAGVRIEGVYTMDGSRRSRRGNAFVAGFGPTTRVVVFDTMLDMPLERLSQVVAHEIGHYRCRHIVKRFPLLAVQAFIALAFVEIVGGSDTVLGWAGVASLGDPGAAPLFLAAFAVPMAVLGVVGAVWSRRDEREADLEALELLRDPTEFLSVWPDLVTRNKADLEPSWWQRLNAAHPEPPERMQFGVEWAARNDEPVSVPERAAVPSAGATQGAEHDGPDPGSHVQGR